MQYERPRIIRRESILALLIDSGKSDQNDVVVSDVNEKDNILPVAWESTAAIEYAKPRITSREGLEALLDVTKSDPS